MDGVGTCLCIVIGGHDLSCLDRRGLFGSKISFARLRRALLSRRIRRQDIVRTQV